MLRRSHLSILARAFVLASIGCTMENPYFDAGNDDGIGASGDGADADDDDDDDNDDDDDAAGDDDDDDGDDDDVGDDDGATGDDDDTPGDDDDDAGLTGDEDDGVTGDDDDASVVEPWGDPHCARRMSLHLRNAEQATALDDFPVLVELGTEHYDGVVVGDGTDVRFRDGTSGQPLLAHELEDPGTGSRQLFWVRVPSVDAASNDDSIWVYFSCSTSASQDPSALWSAGYAGVWHLDESLRDSTAAGLHGSNGGSSSVTGRVARGRYVDGSGQRIEVPIDTAVQTASTVSVWANYDWLSDGIGNNMLVSCGGVTEDATDNYWYTLNLEVDRYLHTYWEYAQSENYDWLYSSQPAVVSAGEWHHYAFVRDEAAKTVRYFVDGEPVGSVQSYSMGPSGGTAASLWFGAAQSGPEWFSLRGSLDEVRVATPVRSADWMRAEYAAMTGGFVSYGDVEEQ